METKDWIIVGIAVSPVIIGVVTLAWYLISRDKKEEKERKLKEPEEKKQRELDRRRVIARDFFHIDFNEMSVDLASEAYDEIVRAVNLEAKRLAILCVKQDEINRKDTYSIEHSNSISNINRDIQAQKTDWSFLRRQALEINPELITRMPHFSEFEPLKSYREEHLFKKEARKN